MDQEGSTSFIPKRVLARTDRPPTEPVNILLTLAFTILVIALLFFGATYFYKRQLEQGINNPCTDLGDNTKQCGLRASLELEKQNLDQSTILLLQRTDRKFKAAKEILLAHQDILPLFQLLEELTIPTIRYTKFAYAKDKSLSLEGKASSYEDVAVQGRVFSRDHTRVKDFLFSDLDLDSQGNVVFKLTVNFDQSLLAFARANITPVVTEPVASSTTP